MSKVEDRGAYVRQDLKRLKIRRLDSNRYRVSDLNGRGVEYRKRHELPDAVAKTIDKTTDGVIYVDGWISRNGRWSVRSATLGAEAAATSLT